MPWVLARHLSAGNWRRTIIVTVLLNGTSVGTQYDFSHSEFRNLTSFCLTSGFVSGANTLDFIVHNIRSHASPTGLLIADLCGTAQVENTPVVPEANSIALFTYGLAVLVATLHVRSNRRALKVVPLQNRRLRPSRRINMD